MIKEFVMKFTRLFLISISIFTLLLAVPAQAQNNGASAMSAPEALAVIDLVDPVGVFLSNSTSDCTGPTSVGAADNSYALVLTTAKRVTIDAMDCCCVGDFYQTSVNGVPFNTTPDPFDYCPADTDPWGCASGTCFPVSAGESTECLPAGTYRVTVNDLGFLGHSAAEISAESMCGAGWTDSFDTMDADYCSCGEAQAGLIRVMPGEGFFRNHGQYVRTAVHTLETITTALSEECHSCIINQFARSIPQGDMAACGDL
jgi:hypothetical protein